MIRICRVHRLTNEPLSVKTGVRFLYNENHRLREMDGYDLH